MTGEQQAMIFAQIMFSPQWLNKHPDFLKNFTKAAPLNSVSPEMIQRQAIATTMWKGTCDRLGSITQRTLVIAGDQDLAAPPANSVICWRPINIIGINMVIVGNIYPISVVPQKRIPLVLSQTRHLVVTGSM